MCPLTGRALPSAPAEMPACCFLLGLAGGLLWLPTHDPQTLCCCQGNGSAFLVHCFFFFLNWINWSNRRLSYPHCHAFYLSLIALFPCLPQSLYLQTIFVPGVSSCLSSATFYTNDLQSLCLPRYVLLLILVCPLFAPSFCGGNSAFFLFFTRRYSEEELNSHPRVRAQ